MRRSEFDALRIRYAQIRAIEQNIQIDRRSLDRLPVCDRSAAVPIRYEVLFESELDIARCVARRASYARTTVFDIDAFGLAAAERAWQEISHGRLPSAC